MTDEQFLATIAADPTDRTARVAYADWLEEQNDPRHELVRVCERMRQLPVFSDDYWRLKARRNELRACCPTEWVAATGYDGGDYDPVFRDGVPDDWKGRWRVVREFTERWHGFQMPDIGGRSAEIRATESRLGMTLPSSVREYIAFAHDVFPEPETPVVLRDIYTLEIMPGHPAVSLMIQGEGDMHWAVHLSDLSDLDPLVHTYIWDHEYDGPDETRPFRPYPNENPVPVSQWALDYTEGYNHTASEFAASVADVEPLRQQLEEAFFVHRQPFGIKQYRYEHRAGILASLRSTVDHQAQVRLWVGVRDGVPWQAVPEFLWKYARRNRMCSGMFLSQEEVERGLGHWGSGPLPPDIMREAVPPMRKRTT